MRASIIASLCIALSQMLSVNAQPVGASDFIITHLASDYFPDAKSDLSNFDVDVKFIGLNTTIQSWLTGLDPASGNSDEEKARIITAAAYAKPFDANDSDMARDVDSLLAAINGDAAPAQKRDGASYDVSSDNAIGWSYCANYLSCASGASCGFYLPVGQKPRSQCQIRNNWNCCISWSSYSVGSGFFADTWNNCNGQVHSEGLSTASCKGFGGSGSNGNVCLSNRASHCS